VFRPPHEFPQHEIHHLVAPISATPLKQSQRFVNFLIVWVRYPSLCCLIRLWEVLVHSVIISLRALLPGVYLIKSILCSKSCVSHRHDVSSSLTLLPEGYSGWIQSIKRVRQPTSRGKRRGRVRLRSSGGAEIETHFGLVRVLFNETKWTHHGPYLDYSNWRLSNYPVFADNRSRRYWLKSNLSNWLFRNPQSMRVQ
jgi:hypothetical protein